jgi:cation diffusion facilitator family transporter
MNRYDQQYPVGRARLEALSVLACAFIMSFASVEVIQASCDDLYQGVAHNNPPDLEATGTVYGTIVAGIVAKFFLWQFCRWAQKVLASDSLEALAEDHFNDVLSNSAAIVTLGIAVNVATAWWVDAAGGIAISLVIIWRWVAIGFEQVQKIIGRTAPDDFIAAVEEMAQLHDPRLIVDCTRAYHYGARYNVEMEVILPGHMTVRESHDIALALQHKIEGLPEVERAFVHVDHEERDGLEHKVERELVKNAIHPPDSPSAPPGGTPGSLDFRKRVNAKKREGDN